MLSLNTTGIFFFSIVPLFFLGSFDWSSPTVISSKNATQPAIAVDPQGNSVAVWVSKEHSETFIQSASRIVGSDWKLIPFSLSQEGQNGDLPKVAVDNSGNAIAIWASSFNSGMSIQASTLTFGEYIWNQPILLSTADKIASSPQIKVDGIGNCIAVWSVIQNGDYHIQGAILQAGAAQWKALHEIHPNLANNLALAVNNTGNSTIIWVGHQNHKNIIQAAILPVGTLEWIQTRDLTPSNIDSSYPDVGMDATGNSIAVWQSGMGSSSTIESARLIAGSATWTEIKTAMDLQATSFQPHIGVDAAGNAAAVWMTLISNSHLLIQGVCLHSGEGEWSYPEDLSDNTIWGAIEPVIAMRRDGVAVAAWSYGMPGMIQTAQLPKPGRWSPSVTVSLPVFNCDISAVAMSSTEGAVVIYQGEDVNCNSVVQAAHGTSSK